MRVNKSLVDIQKIQKRPKKKGGKAWLKLQQFY